MTESPTAPPKKGDQFLHRYRITGSPLAGTVQPVLCEVTAVRKGVVYFRNAGTRTARAAWKIDIEKFPTIVKESND